MKYLIYLFVSFFLCFFFVYCISFFIRLLSWVLCRVCRSLCLVLVWSVKMAAVPVWAPLLPIQPKPKVWNRLHLILNTWQQLERRKGERRFFFFFKKSKIEWICQRAPPYLPSHLLSVFSPVSLFVSFPHHFLVTPESVEKIVSVCQSSCQRHRQERWLLMPFYPPNKVSVPFNRA